MPSVLVAAMVLLMLLLGLGLVVVFSKVVRVEADKVRAGSRGARTATSQDS